jgi:hypothetical protein
VGPAGQLLFKQRVMQIENRCRVTGVNNPVHLMAESLRFFEGRLARFNEDFALLPA